MFLVTTRTTKLLQQWPKSLLLQIQTWSNLAHALAKWPVSIQSPAFSSITGWLTALCRLVKHYANCTTTITLRNVSLLCANVLEVQYNQSTWHFRQHMNQQNLWYKYSEMNCLRWDGPQANIILNRQSNLIPQWKCLSSLFLEFIYWSANHNEMGWNYHWQENSCKYVTNFETILFVILYTL